MKSLRPVFFGPRSSANGGFFAPVLLWMSFVVLGTLFAGNARAANFFEGFDGTGGPGDQWEGANWTNGSIFGCRFAHRDAWRTGWGSLHLNVNGSNPNDVTCSEVRTWQSFLYGKFITRLQPGTIAGGNTAIFLYTGNPGSGNHFEIDMEFIHSGTVLHTNVWIRGQQNIQQFPISQGWRTIGFEWRPGLVRWFHVNDDGGEIEFRRVHTDIRDPMRLMLNHWVGNNSPDAKGFMGTYHFGGGPAYFDWVRVSD